MQIYMHSMDSIFEIDVIYEDMLSKPLYGKVENASASVEVPIYEPGGNHVGR